MLSEEQRAARANFRRYLGETYGRDKAALIYNIADLESNFRPDATNSTSSAAGLTQITAGHWQTLSNHLRQEISAGRFNPQDLPSGMTTENLADFDRHKFDEVNSAFMTSTNIDFLGERFVNRANAQRALVGKEPVANMAELTGGNYALESFLIAGGHKDGWGVHTRGALEGTGFGAAIQAGEINLPHLFDQYQAARQRNDAQGAEISDGLGHGLTYALYASDNVQETAGGPKLQLTPSMVKQGIELRAPNVRIDHSLTQTWIDRAQQADPGFEPTDADEAQWLQRLDLLDPSLQLGANDVQTTNTPIELRDESIPRSRPIVPVAQPEVRSVSDDPSVAARAENRFGGRLRRGLEEALGTGLEFLVGDAQAATPADGPVVNTAQTTPVPQTRGNRLARNTGLDRAEDQFANRNGQTQLGEDRLAQSRAAPTTPDIASPSVALGSRQVDDIRQRIAAEGPTPELLRELELSLSGNTFEEPAGTPVVDPQNPAPGFGSGAPTPITTLAELASPDGTGAPTPQTSLFDPAAAARRATNDQRITDAENFLTNFQDLQRLDSADLETQALARAGELRNQTNQDLALSLAPTFDVAQPEFQRFQNTRIQDFAVPQQTANFAGVGNVLPTNAQLQDVVDVGRLTDDDFLRRAAGQVLSEDQFGSLNEFINRSRGTDFEAQQDELFRLEQIETARIGADGTVSDQEQIRLDELAAQRESLIPVLSQETINRSRIF